ncbi:hypothetical protein [Algicola sagamiensis]|uniref:hypothetical protein n=1 Tax=Algicola sagamiensis TaxID=163869 RepID=UPI000368F8B9|nr:hypothetical protein [Algicola sagamiensis]
MKVYRLSNNPQEFKTLALDVINLATQLGDRKLNVLLRSQCTTNESLLEVWNDQVECSMRDVLGKDSAIPDVSLWNGPNILLSEKAYAVLGPELQDGGDFLPIKVDGTYMQIFNCRSFGKENDDLCTTKYIDGVDFGPETLAFDDADINNRFVFKSKFEGGLTLFATEKFKALCEKKGLEGLIFKEDLLDPYIY